MYIFYQAISSSFAFILPKNSFAYWHNKLFSFKIIRVNYTCIFYVSRNDAQTRLSHLNVDYKIYRRQLHRLYSHNNKSKRLKYNEIFLDANGYNFEDLAIEEQYAGDTIYSNDIIGSFLGSICKYRTYAYIMR